MASRLEKLKAVAVDLNTKMKLDPPIDTDTDSAKELKQRILAEMEVDGGQVYDTDVNTLESATWEYLTTGLNIEPRQAPASSGAGQATKSTEEQKEDTTVAEKKKTTKKAAAKKKTTPAKKKAAPKATAAKKTPAKKKAEGGPSNKERVYKLWKKGKGMTDSEKLHKEIGGGAQAKTIKSWLSAWANGKNLPACANK